jgi:hypothetical protein
LFNMLLDSWSQWLRSLRCKSATFHLLGIHVWRGLSSGLIISPEGSFQVWCVWGWSWSLDNEKALVH